MLSVFTKHMLVHSAYKPFPVANHVLVPLSALYMILSAPGCERPRIKPAHTCAGHVFSACGIDSCLKWFMSGPGGSAAFDVDVKPPSHPSLHLSSASCCSPFLSIRLPFFLSSFLPLFPSLTPTLSLSASHTLARTEVSVPSTHPMRD